MLSAFFSRSTLRARGGALRSIVGATAVLQLLAGCVIATPYRVAGAGSAATGEVIVVVTEATLRSDSPARADFWDGVRDVSDALSETPGLIGYSVRQEPFGDRAWTMTTWDSEASLMAFVWSPAHQRAMDGGMAALSDSRFVRVTRRADQPPLTWDEALAALESGARRYDADVATSPSVRDRRNE